jgi:hypothetical protein
MAWAKNGTPDTLTSASTTLTISDLSALKFNVFMMHSLPNGSETTEPRFSLTNGSGTGHASRQSRDGGADSTTTSVSSWVTSITDAADDNFSIGYLCNIDGEEKLVITFNMINAGSGAGTAPRRREVVGKYTDGGSNSQVTRIDNVDTSTDKKAIDSNLSALGTD